MRNIRNYGILSKGCKIALQGKEERKVQGYDAVVIGAGVIGCAVARELSRKSGRFLVLEKEPDVCEGTSKANSAIVHAGFDAVPGTWKAKMNVRGNAMMDQLARELDIPFQRTGALVVCLDPQEKPKLLELLERGKENGVPGLRIVEGDELRAMEPNLSDNACCALLAETSGIICPFELTLGMAESAAKNGVEFRFDTEVTGIEAQETGWLLHTAQGEISTGAVINCAGVYADRLHNLVSEKKLKITPRRGEYLLLDKTAGEHVSRTVFQLPGKYGKGVLVTPTVHGNLLIGPTADDGADKEFTATTAGGLAEVQEKSALAVKSIPLRQVITSFAGLRAHEEQDDFLLEEAADGYYCAAGIESPGLTSAPAIGEYLAGEVARKLNLKEKEGFDPLRRGVPRIRELPAAERAEMIRKNPAYGAIVCRCEQISEGEILDAIHGILGAKTLDGVKRRTRAGMGRCQSGFCSPRVMELLAKELSLDLTEIRKNGKSSPIVLQKIRGEGAEQ